MFLDNFWKILFGIALIVALSFWWGAYKKKKSYQFLVRSIAQAIDSREDSAAKNEEEAKVRLFGALHIMHTANNRGHDLSKLIEDACTRLGYGAYMTRINSEGLIEAYGVGERLGIYEIDELYKLADGATPTVSKGPWEGERVVLARRLHKDILPKAQFVLANLTLVPESVEAINVGTYTKGTERMANKLLRVKIIDDSEADMIRRRYKEQRY